MKTKKRCILKKSWFVGPNGPSFNRRFTSPKSSSCSTACAQAMSRPSLLLALRPLRNQCEQAALRRCRPSYYNALLLDRDVTCRTAPLSRRPFSTSPKCLITNAIKPHVKGKSQPSMALAMKRQREQMMRSGETPDDVGLQPNTFVMPHGANLPGLLTDTRTRLRMEWARLKIRSGEIVR